MSDLSRTLRREVARLQEENESLREEVRTLREYLDALHALMDAVDDLDPSAQIMPLLDRMLHNAMVVTNANDGSLLVVDEETEELVFVLAHGDIGQEPLSGHRIPPGKGIAGWVVKNEQPTIVNNAYADDRFYAGVDQAFEFQTNSILAAPIVGGGRILGVIEVLNKQSGLRFGTPDQTLLTLLCRFAGEVLHTMIQRDEQAAEAGEPDA
jgi:GAF domain-containing protein